MPTSANKISKRLNRGSRGSFQKLGSIWPVKASKSTHAVEQLLLEKLQPAPGDRILDGSCGPGVLACLLAQSDFHSIGVDKGKKTIRRAKKTAWRADVQDHVRFAQANLDNLDGLEDNSFDHAFIIDSLGESTDVPKCLGELRRLLRPGGKIVIIDIERDKLEDIDVNVAHSILVCRHAGKRWPIHGSYSSWLQGAGFEEVHAQDMSGKINPVHHVSRVASALPYLLLRPFGLHKHFPNIYASQKLYGSRARKSWKYIAITATKAMEDSESTATGFPSIATTVGTESGLEPMAVETAAIAVADSDDESEPIEPPLRSPKRITVDRYLRFSFEAGKAPSVKDRSSQIIDDTIADLTTVIDTMVADMSDIPAIVVHDHADAVRQDSVHTLQTTEVKDAGAHPNEGSDVAELPDNDDPDIRQRSNTIDTWERDSTVDGEAEDRLCSDTPGEEPEPRLPANAYITFYENLSRSSSPQFDC